MRKTLCAVTAFVLAAGALVTSATSSSARHQAPPPPPFAEKGPGVGMGPLSPGRQARLTYDAPAGT